MPFIRDKTIIKDNFVTGMGCVALHVAALHVVFSSLPGWSCIARSSV